MTLPHQTDDNEGLQSSRERDNRTSDRNINAYAQKADNNSCGVGCVAPNGNIRLNSAPHEATGDSPFYILHAFDPHGPLREVPQENLSWNHIECDD